MSVAHDTRLAVFTVHVPAFHALAGFCCGSVSTSRSLHQYAALSLCHLIVRYAGCVVLLLALPLLR
jgi:hypothetical protein